ncbi:MAG: hypothetical protein IT373_06580 [Polyangiaceae bacterium]|nr:hypothetical protein [Polyangiaceae bacterium]
MRPHSSLAAFALVAWLAPALAGCSSRGSDAAATAVPSLRRYRIAPPAGAPVTIEVAIPPGWTEEPGRPDEPRLAIAGATARLLTFAALELRGDAAARMEKAIALQYGADAAGVERSDLPGGRVWMVAREPENLHARLFVPFEGGVLMGVAILAREAESRLPEVRTAFESIAIVAAP